MLTQIRGDYCFINLEKRNSEKKIHNLFLKYFCYKFRINFVSKKRHIYDFVERIFEMKKTRIISSKENVSLLMVQYLRNICYKITTTPQKVNISWTKKKCCSFLISSVFTKSLMWKETLIISLRPLNDPYHKRNFCLDKNKQALRLIVKNSWQPLNNRI